ncbi:MAG TPA: T9SS type A sorting domain-containing protein, partial [Flavisolibacter sp.]|nr:T9SS type A sorting domain-containing protein [Flavisolibacter sp.]
WSLLESRVLYVAQRAKAGAITAAEYFFDADPGHGAAQPLDIVAGDSLRLVGEIELPFTQLGLHQLYIRTRTADGIWSLVESRPVYVSSRVNTTIAGAEYFFDEDPGHGGGTPIAINYADGQPLVTEVNTSNLANGFHQLYVRNRTVDGVWSLVEGRLFYISPSLNKWVQAEYFFDDKDPGVGKAVPVNLNLSSNTNNLLVALPDTMKPGVHTITLRARNGSAAWDFSETKTFIIEAFPAEGVVLPVKLEYFRGNLLNNEVPLQWKTASEENAGIFEVERSANGLQFTTIGRVKAQGNANGQLYGFTDKNPGRGAQYYRLKHTDKNGKVDYSGVLYFYLSAEQGLRLYPNPATTSVFINLQNSANPTSLRVISSNGQVVYTNTVKNKNLVEIPVRQLPNGNYFVEISQGANVRTLPFVKQ